MAFLYKRARRLTAQNGGFRPGQAAKTLATEYDKMGKPDLAADLRKDAATMRKFVMVHQSPMGGAAIHITPMYGHLHAPGTGFVRRITNGIYWAHGDDRTTRG